MVAGFHRRWRGSAIFLLIAFFCPFLCRAEVLKEEDAYDLIIRGIKDQLQRKERFTPLPNNIAALSVRPDGKPIFSILGGAQAGEFKRNSGRNTYLKDEGSFLVSRFGTVAAVFGDSIVLQRPADTMKPGVNYPIAIIKPTRVELLDFSYDKVPKQIFWTGSDWGFVIQGGIKLDSSTNSQVTVPTTWEPAKVFKSGSGAVMVTRPPGTTGYDQNNDLVVTLKDSQGLKQSRFKGYRELGKNLQALLPLTDGRYLAVAEKLVSLRTNCPPAPTDQEMKSFLDAWQQQDREKFGPALQAATEYPVEHSQALVTAFRNVRDPNSRYEYAALSARNALEAKPITPGQERVNAALKDFLRILEEVRAGDLGVTPTRLAELIRDGYQYFDGQWIRNPQLITQKETEVILEASFVDTDWKARRGVFRLDDRGHLQRLFAYEHETLASACQIFKTATGEEMFFFPFEGLARLSNGKLEWLDRSDEMKWMEQVVGSDNEGRIFFSSGESAAAGGSSGSFNKSARGWVIVGRASYGEKFWVYRPTIPRSLSPIQRLFPVAHYPIMDSAHRIWFCPTVPPQFAIGPAAGSLAGCEAAVRAQTELSAAPPRSMSVTTLARAPERTFGAAEIDAKLDLYCREDGKIFRCLTNLPLSTTLLAGSNGCVLGTVQDRDEQGAFIIENGQAATLGIGLHQLAEKNYSLLFNAAPAASQPPGFRYLNSIIHSIHFNPSLCRMNDLLWLNDRDKVEVYRDGKPLGLQLKLTIPSRKLALLGPFSGTNGYQMLICNPFGSDAYSSQSRIGFLWAAPIGDGVEVTTADQWPMGGLGVTPVFHRARGDFYLEETLMSSRVVTGPGASKRLFNTGKPVIALKNGDWIYQTAAPFANYRVVSGEQATDMKLSLARPFEILAELEDERLLCATPEGLLWLQRKGDGQFTISKDLPLHTGGFAFSFIGEDAKQLYLALADSRSQVYLAVVDRP